MLKSPFSATCVDIFLQMAANDSRIRSWESGKYKKLISTNTEEESSISNQLKYVDQRWNRSLDWADEDLLSIHTSVIAASEKKWDEWRRGVKQKWDGTGATPSWESEGDNVQSCLRKEGRSGDSFLIFDQLPYHYHCHHRSHHHHPSSLPSSPSNPKVAALVGILHVIFGLALLGGSTFAIL